MEWAVILAGGSGTRFWPLSTRDRPKHLLPLAGPVPTAAAAVGAVEPLIPRERILLVTGRALARPLAEATGLPSGQVLVEPQAASTAPALVWAAHHARARDPDAALLCLHADWYLADPARFREAAGRALYAAIGQDRLVAVGVVPTRPDPGYGYILGGDEVAPGVRAVERFEEKPTPERARELIAQGALWNSGLFAWTAARLRLEVEACAPEVAPALPLLDGGQPDRFFAAVRPVSIDVGVLERSARVATVRGDFPWDDVGTWDALARIRERDGDGNVRVGPVHAVESRGCVAWSDGPPMVLYGVDDLVAVVANGRVLILPRARAADLKRALEQLPPEVRDLP